MNEQFDSNKLQQINENLVKIDKKLGSYWTQFLKGLLYGLGTVIGAGLAIILIGWFLNVIGVIPGVKKAADQWRAALQQTQDIKNYAPTDGANPATQQPSQ